MMIMSTTELIAQSVGTPFMFGGSIYKVSKKDVGHPERNEAVLFTAKGTGKVVIPARVTTPKGMDQENYKVVGCASWGATVEDGVTELEFEEGIPEISDYSLRKPQNLKKVIIPASCKKVGIGCFVDCPSLESFVVKAGNPNYKSLDNGALVSADGTKLVYVPGGKVGEFTISNGVTEILPTAITNCRKLTRVTIPASVNKLSELEEFPSISGSATRFTVDAANSKYCDKDGLLCSKDGKTLIHVPYKYDKLKMPGDELIIPETITKINKAAAISCYMKKVTLNNVENIGVGAFNSCSALETVKIGKKIDKIGTGAFTNCSRISAFEVDDDNKKYQAVEGVIFTKPTPDHLVLYPSGKEGAYTVPEGTKIIDENAFADVFYLNKITLAKSVEKIEKFAFKGAKKLEEVDFNNTEKLTSIGEQAFTGTPLKKVTIPSCVTTLGVAAFSQLAELTEVKFAAGSKLTELSSNLFQNCKKLEKVLFDGENNINTISSAVFDGCEKLKNLAIPQKVTVIASGAFKGTKELETVTFAENAILDRIGESAFAESGIKHIELPQSVKTIQTLAFDHCASLKEIKLPKDFSNVAEGAFNFCESLLKFIVESGNTRYSTLDGMLCDINKTTLEVFPAGKADSKYTLIPYFTTIAPYAFYGSQKISNITFPRSVTKIGIRAIALCENLSSLSFMGETKIPELNDNIFYRTSNQKNIIIYVRKKWYEISENEEKIKDYNIHFKEVHPSFVTTVGYDRGTEFFPTSNENVGAISFYNERTSVILGETAKEEAMTEADKFGKKFPAKEYKLSSILDFAYEDTKTVKAIVALGELGYIGMNAFKGSSIKDLYFVGNVPGDLGSEDYDQKGSYSFKDKQNIYVKESKVETYKKKWEVTKTNGSSDKHELMITYKIPQHTYNHGGTVCFPFDVKYPSTGGDDDVKPYVPVDFGYIHSADHPIVRAFSLDNYYLPAFTGAFIRSKKKTEVSSYCQMDESQSHDKIVLANYEPTADNRMIGAVEDTPITNEAGFQYYAFSKGKLVKVNDGVNFPYFKAYLRLKKLTGAGAKAYTLVFDEEGTGSTTGINGVVEFGGEETPYYNLSGVRVNRPTRGLYIHNGKKIVVK